MDPTIYEIDKWHPRYEEYKNNKDDQKFCRKIINLENEKYGAEFWNPILDYQTIDAELIKLEDLDIQKILDTGKIDNPYLIQMLEKFLNRGFIVVCTSQEPPPIYSKTIEDITNILQIYEVYSSLERGCKYLFLRRQVHIRKVYSIYVFQNRIRYMEHLKLDSLEQCEIYDFISLDSWITLYLIPQLKEMYDGNFLADVFLDMKQIIGIYYLYLNHIIWEIDQD